MRWPVDNQRNMSMLPRFDDPNIISNTSKTSVVQVNQVVNLFIVEFGQLKSIKRFVIESEITICDMNHSLDSIERRKVIHVM